MIEDPRPLILHVIHHLYIGGMENGLVNLVNRLPESRFRHAIACVEDYSDFRKRLTRNDVDVFALHRSRIGVWRMRREIFNLCRRLRPALIHTRNLSGLDALAPARLAGVPRCVHGEHGWDVDDLNGHRWKPAMLRRLHRPLVDRYVTVSKHLAHYLVERVGVASERITWISNGVDSERFKPAAIREIGALPPGFAAEDSIVVGSVGRIQAVKDHVTLVRAFSDVSRTNPTLARRLRLAIVGDGPLLEPLRALVKESGIEAKTWLPGAVGDVPHVLRSFDFFVLPSLAEGVSNTVLEAMCSGLPILATNVGGNVEIVDDGVSGQFFNPRDVQTLARLIAEYANDPQLRATHARAARRAAIERFCIDRMVDQYGAIYASMCGGDRAVAVDSRERDREAVS